MNEWESWQQADLTDDQPAEHVQGRAAHRRELAQFRTVAGNVRAARELTRLATSELRSAAMHGEANLEEMRVVDVLLPTWAGSGENLLATARAILAEQGQRSDR